MVSSHRIPTIAILCIFVGPFSKCVRHLGRGREETEKATENEMERRACSQKSDFYIIFFVTTSFLLAFSLSSDNITEQEEEHI